MNYIREIQRSNKTQSIENVLKAVSVVFEKNRERIEKAPKLNQLIKTPIELSQLEIVGYLQGDKVDRCASMSWDNFSFIEFWNESQNARNGQKTLLFVCHGSKDKVMVVAKRKNNYIYI